jgi:hypothetical protein
MMKIFRTNSKKRLGHEDDEEVAVDRKGKRRSHDSRPNSEKYLEDPPPESSPVLPDSSPVAVAAAASMSTAPASPRRKESGVFDNSAFFGSPLRMQDWDEWSVPKEGSSKTTVTIQGVAKAFSSLTLSPTRLTDRELRKSDHAGGSFGRPSPSNTPSAQKKKGTVALSDKLRKLESTGFTGGGANVDDTQSLMAMTTGGMPMEKSADPRSLLESLILERSNSDPQLNGKKKKKKKSKQKSSNNAPTLESKETALEKKVRKPRRQTLKADDLSKTSYSRSARSRSGSRSGTRRKPTMSVAISPSRSVVDIDKSPRDLKNENEVSKKKIKKEKPIDGDQTKRSESLSTFTKESRESKSSKKDKKKREGKGETIPPDNNSESVSSTSTLTEPIVQSIVSPFSVHSRESEVKEKNRKVKDKIKKGVKRNKSSTDVPSLPNYDCDNTGRHDGNVFATLERLADEIRSTGSGKSGSGVSVDLPACRKEPVHSTSGISSASVTSQERGVRGHSSNDMSSMAMEPPRHDLTGKAVTEEKFENVWSSHQPANSQQDKYTGENTNAQATKIQRNIHSYPGGDQSPQLSPEIHDFEKISNLQNQLGEALDKILAMSRAQIQDQDHLSKVSSDLSRTKAELQEALDERNELIQELKRRESTIEEEGLRIADLELVIEKQLDDQDVLELKLERSEDEVKQLLEIQQLEDRKSDGVGAGRGGASLIELHQTKKALAEKEAELISQNERIEQLELELRNSLTVPQLQIEELDAEMKKLKGKMKDEKVEYVRKLEAKDNAMAKLQRELDSYNASSDAPDLVSAKQKLADARADATAVREDLLAAKRMVDELQGERDDLVTRNNSLVDTIRVLEKDVEELTEKSEALNEKVKLWTEKTYHWKSKAEFAEQKLDAWSEESYDGSSVDSREVRDAPQGLFLQAAMGKGRKSKWYSFVKGGEGSNETADDIRIRTLEERNQTLEDELAELRSELIRMGASHKDELSSTQKKVARLEGENEALSLQNATLKQLSTANQASENCLAQVPPQEMDRITTVGLSEIGFLQA